MPASLGAPGRGPAEGKNYNGLKICHLITAIALLALRGYEKEPGVQASLIWLVNRLCGCPSAYSLAWGIFALVAFRRISSEVDETLGAATRTLVALMEDADRITEDACTIALCALALDAAEGDNVFEVHA